jgi:hypothetical protein
MGLGDLCRDLSMRTPGGAVVRGRWGRSRIGGSREESLAAYAVAVFEYRTAGELAQVQGVGFAGQASVSGQVPGEGEPFGVGEGGLGRGECGGWGGSGHRVPPGRAETREAGPATGPSD